MRFSEIMQLLKEYMIVGVIAAILVLIIVFIFIMKNKTKLDKSKIAKIMTALVFVCYIIVLIGATMFSRDSIYGRNINWHLLSSYKEVWYSFSATEWRNLILNIFLFVPMGFLLPLLCKKKWWKIYLTGFLTSILIEGMQFIFNRGIVEIDDILNNTLGTMIGFGIYAIIMYIITISKKKKLNTFICICYQIPLFTVAIIYLTIFAVYNNQRYGNLPEHYIIKQDMSHTIINSKLNPSEDTTEAPVYQLEVASLKQMKEKADFLLGKIDSSVDDTLTDKYEDTVVFKTEDGNYSLWIDYNGMTTWFTNFTEMESEKSTQFTDEEIISILENYGIDIPENVAITISDSNDYIINADMILKNDVLIDGSLSCSFTINGDIKEYRNNIITYQKYGDESLISVNDAMSQIYEGKFICSVQDLEGKITISDVHIEYRIDSKGYYQPVYVFSTDGDMGNIIIPAIQ